MAGGDRGKRVGIVVQGAQRVAVALGISIGVALLLLILWKGSWSVLFLRAITLGLAATAIFSLFEVWPRSLPRGVERWIVQVVAVGVAMPLTVFVMHRRATSPGALPFFEDHNWMLVGYAANHIGRRAHLVFVTAYDHYAVEAFAQGALDYLLKPVELIRLTETVNRLKERVQASRPAINTEQLLRQLTEQLATLQSGGSKKGALRWIRAQAGRTVRLIAIEDVDYLRSDAKYTIVAWREGGKPAEAVVRTPLKDLAGQLDAAQFAQVHRSVVVNLHAISHVKRHGNETAEIHLKGRNEVLPVSRNYVHLFRQM